MSTSNDMRRVEDAHDKIKRAFKSIEDGRILKQEIYVVDGMDKMKHALRDLDAALQDLKRSVG